MKWRDGEIGNGIKECYINAALVIRNLEFVIERSVNLKCFKLNNFAVFNFTSDGNRIAADFAILHICLRIFSGINKHCDFFKAVRAGKFVFYLHKIFYLLVGIKSPAVKITAGPGFNNYYKAMSSTLSSHFST